MQGITEGVNAAGFYPETFQVTGNKSYRFKRDQSDSNKSCWYYIFENQGDDGELFYVYHGGDFKTDEEITIFSKGKLSPSENKKFKADLEEIRIAREKETELMRAACKAESQDLLSRSIDAVETPYTIRKKIKPFGAKALPLDKQTLLIPVKTVGSELVGLQKIYENGKKYYHPGTNKKGNFHLIGENINGEVYVCEGFATGASIHMATEKPVVVAFDAGNLEPVTREIRIKYPSTKIIICGDDDRFTQDNPGRKYAEAAAKKGSAIALFPTFKEQKNGLTDFNDLHVEEGLDAVKEQLNKQAEKSMENEIYLKPLGVHGEKYFYISSLGNQVISFTASGHTKNNLFGLMPLSYWENLYYVPKKGVKWDQAFSDLMISCQKIGPFNPEKIRGVGVWEDRGRLLINTGSGIYCDSKMVGLKDIETRYIYQSGPKFQKPVANPLSVEECKPIIDCVINMKWKKEESPYLLCGFVVLARFCGALQWRPHAWITGGFGSGKTSIMDKFVRPILGDESLYFQGSTTEAGVRQSVSYNSRPVIFDEFETVDKSTDLRIKSVLDLMRQASSESDARIAKGSAGGAAIDYRATFCAIVSSIRVNLTNSADKSRFCVLELEKIEKNSNQWEDLKKHLDKLTPEFSARLFSRVFHMWPVIKENQKLLQKALAEKYDQRVGQQYGTLLAGFACLTSDAVLVQEEVKAMVNLLDYSERESISQETDESDCLNHIHQTKTRLEVEGSIYERSIGEFLDEAKNSDFRKAIRRIGLDVVDGYLLIANQHSELAKIFKETKWSAGWKNSLARIKGAEISKGTHSFGTNCNVRFVKVPLTLA